MRLQNKRRLSIPGRGAIFTDKRWTRWGLLISERKWIRVGDTRETSTGQTKLQRQIGKTLKNFRKGRKVTFFEQNF